jgi:uncharacterized protein YegL
MSTHVTFVLDASGSMEQIAADTVGGFNSFLADQRAEPGEATVSLYEFDSTVGPVYERRPIAEAPELRDETYTPGGQTALHDAIVTAIDETVARLSALDPGERPETVVTVVLTDGKENASETPQAAVRDRIESKQADGWEFLFIGANQDAALTAGRMGIDADQSLDMAHTDEGARAAYESTADQVSQARREGSTSGFDDADRRRQDDAE